MLFFFYACKKEPNSQTISTGGQSAFNCGVLIEKRTYTAQDTVQYSEGNTTAFFTDTIYTDSDCGPQYSVFSVGQVSINGTILKESFYPYSSKSFYLDTTGNIFGSQQTITISGGNGYSACSFVNNYDYPQFNGYRYFPDTLRCSFDSKFKLPLMGYLPDDEISISIVDHNLKYLSYPVRIVPGATSIEFLANDIIYNLAGFPDNSYIVVEVSKHFFYPVGDRYCLLKQTHSYFSKVYIDPF